MSPNISPVLLLVVNLAYNVLVLAFFSSFASTFYYRGDVKSKGVPDRRFRTSGRGGEGPAGGETFFIYTDYILTINRLFEASEALFLHCTFLIALFVLYQYEFTAICNV